MRTSLLGTGLPTTGSMTEPPPTGTATGKMYSPINDKSININLKIYIRSLTVTSSMINKILVLYDDKAILIIQYHFVWEDL